MSEHADILGGERLFELQRVIDENCDILFPYPEEAVDMEYYEMREETMQNRDAYCEAKIEIIYDSNEYARIKEMSDIEFFKYKMDLINDRYNLQEREKANG